MCNWYQGWSTLRYFFYPKLSPFFHVMFGWLGFFPHLLEHHFNMAVSNHTPSTVYTRREKNFWRWLESNPGPLAAQAIALTTRTRVLRHLSVEMKRSCLWWETMFRSSFCLNHRRKRVQSCKASKWDESFEMSSDFKCTLDMKVPVVLQCHCYPKSVCDFRALLCHKDLIIPLKSTN